MISAWIDYTMGRLDQARGWFQKAAEAGYTSAVHFIGALCAAQGDADGASRAWHKVIEEDQQDELVFAAALALARCQLKADYQFARELLEIAGTRGWSNFLGIASYIDREYDEARSY